MSLCSHIRELCSDWPESVARVGICWPSSSRVSARLTIGPSGAKPSRIAGVTINYPRSGCASRTAGATGSSATPGAACAVHTGKADQSTSAGRAAGATDATSTARTTCAAVASVTAVTTEVAAK